MRLNKIIKIVLVTLTCFTTQVRAEAPNPWISITLGDLERMNELISKNHPGPVDPENTEFRAWLDQGIRQATVQASKASNFYDYKRVLLRFANGFNDGHMEIWFTVDAHSHSWPGFLPTVSDHETADHVVRVAYSEVKDVPVGATIISCDDVPTWKLLADRVLPYWWNSKIPNRLPVVAAQHLFMIDANDRSTRLETCVMDVNGTSSTRTLSWRGVTADDAEALERKALGWVTAELGVRQIDGIWFVSMPSYLLTDDSKVAAYKAMLADLVAKRDQVRRGPLVFDLRGNHGGSDAWGLAAAKIIWGEDLVSWVKESLGQVIDWRVSEDNIKRHEQIAQMEERNGLVDEARFYHELAQNMETALKEGRPFVRTGTAGKPRTPPPPNPVTGHAYLLTNGTCFSACLSVVDVVSRIPGVRHVGTETSGDTVYIENSNVDLPSSLAVLSYSLKVYRSRVRPSNVWYTPDVAWQGGAMTDDAVARWIRDIEQQGGAKSAH